MDNPKGNSSFIHNPPISDLVVNGLSFQWNRFSIAPGDFTESQLEEVYNAAGIRSAYRRGEYYLAARRSRVLKSAETDIELNTGYVSRGNGGPEDFEKLTALIKDRMGYHVHVDILEAMHNWVLAQKMDDGWEDAFGFLKQNGKLDSFVESWARIAERFLAKQDLLQNPYIQHKIRGTLREISHASGSEYLTRLAGQYVKIGKISESLGSRIPLLKEPRVDQWCGIVDPDNCWDRDSRAGLVQDFNEVLYEFSTFETNERMKERSCRSLANAIRNLIERAMTRLGKGLFLEYAVKTGTGACLKSNTHKCNLTGDAKGACKLLGNLESMNKGLTPGYFAGLMKGVWAFKNNYKAQACERLELFCAFVRKRFWGDFFFAPHRSAILVSSRFTQLVGEGVHEAYIGDYEEYRELFFKKLIEMRPEFWKGTPPSQKDFLSEVSPTAPLALLCDPRTAGTGG